MHHVSSIKKNLISGSLLCRDGYKLVFESNKYVVSKYGSFVGKGYKSGGCWAFLTANTRAHVGLHIVVLAHFEKEVEFEE